MGREMTGIREARTSDTPALVAMGLRFLRESCYRGRIRENAEQMASLVTLLVEQPHGVVFVSERAGQVTGMIGLLLFDQPLSGDRMATELFWWVEPEHRGQGVRLLKHAETWARAQGAKALQMIAPTEGVEQLYRRLGYDRIEVAYQRAL